MNYLNIEIKARCSDAALIRNYLIEQNAEFKGTDYQTDTYFNVTNGRLKLREGKIENNLIFYERNDQPGPKDSKFHLVPVPGAEAFKEILKKSIGVKVIVEKKREIYYINNVKFHIDEVKDLGSFIEIEAGNVKANLPSTELSRQCNFYLHEFGIQEEDLVENSYSDMLIDKLEIKII